MKTSELEDVKVRNVFNCIDTENYDKNLTEV